MKQVIILISILYLSFTSCTDKTNYNFLNGEWVYRSVLNIDDETVPFCQFDTIKCINNLEFATAVMTLQYSNSNISGELDMGQDGKLIMSGNKLEHGKFVLRGTGIKNSSTDGWIYDYTGFLVPEWKDGIDQKDALVGSVIRSADHGNSKKGKVASFYMVKK